MRTFFLTGLLVLFLSGKSQVADINWGPELEVKQTQDFVGFAGCDSTYNYSVVKAFKGFLDLGRTKYYCFRTDLSDLSNSHAYLTLNYGGKKHYFQDAILFNDRLFVLTCSRTKNTDRVVIYCQELDKVNLLPKGDLVKIKEFRSLWVRVQCKISKDKQKLLILLKKKRKGGSQPISVEHEALFFNEEMELLFSKSFPVPKFRMDDAIEFTTDKAGNVHFLYRKYSPHSLTKKEKPTYSYGVQSFSNQGDSISSYDIEIPTDFLVDARLGFVEKNKLTIFGIYSNNNRTKNIKGIFHQDIDKYTGEVLSQKFNDLDEEFLFQGFSGKEVLKWKERIKDSIPVINMQYKITNVLSNIEGQYIVVLEQRYNRTVRDTRGYPKEVFFNNDIIVVNFDKEGEIKWKTKINKRQYVVGNTLYSGFLLGKKGSDVHFIINDHPDNLSYNGEQGVPKNARVARDAMVTQVIVDKDGNVSKKGLQFSIRATTYPSVKNSLDLGNEHVFLIGTYDVPKTYISKVKYAKLKL